MENYEKAEQDYMAGMKYKDMPIKVQRVIQGTVIDVGKEGASQYDYARDILYVAQGADKTEIIHEIGHLVESKMLDADKVAVLRKQMAQEVSPNDIIKKKITIHLAMNMKCLLSNPINLSLIIKDACIFKIGMRCMMKTGIFAMIAYGNLFLSRLESILKILND